MSYAIIKSISFKDNKITINSTSNNVYPRTYSKWFCKSLTKILQENGKDEVIKEILKEFWGGNFQGESTTYGKFITTFKSDFKYENLGKKEEIGKEGFNGHKVLYSYEDLKEELFKQFQEYKTKTSKRNLFFVKLGGNYITRLTTRKAFTSFSNSTDSAKKFTLAQAENIKSRFTNYSIQILEV